MPNIVQDQQNKIFERSLLTQIIMFDYNNTGIDITAETESFEIRTSINSMAECTLIINDTYNNMNTSVPLLGGEHIMITMTNVLGIITVMTKMFVVASIDIIDKNIGGNNKNRYRLSLISTYMYNNKDKISKGYSRPTRIHEIVQDLCDNYLYKNDNQKVKFDIEKTDYVFSNFIIPYSYPIDVINELKKIAKNGTDDFFVFYESFFGLHFRSLSSLLSAAPLIPLVKEPPSSYKDGMKLYKIKDDRFISGINIQRAMKNRGFGSTFVAFNPKTKDIMTKTYKMDKSYLDNIYTLGKKSLYRQKQLYNAEKHDCVYYTNNLDLIDSYGKYDMRREMINMYKTKITLHGTFDIILGQTVSYSTPKTGTENDNMFSGSWMVGEIILKYNMFGDNNTTSNYKTTTTELILIKDAYGNMNRDLANAAGLLNIDYKINNVV
jgi:hypothetical protein